jgi:hypothetical protein
MTKIFGIGLGKTGTRSLYEASKILGLRACHFEVTWKARDRYDSGEDTWLLEKDIDKYDAFFDFIWYDWMQLVARFPDGKFILSYRDLESWLDSRLIHMIHNRFAPNYARNQQDVNTHQWRQTWERHNREVEEWFTKRGMSDQLLKINVCDGEGWEKLCPFLGKPIPDVEFPTKNSSEVRLVNILHFWRADNPGKATMSNEPRTPDVFCKAET